MASPAGGLDEQIGFLLDTKEQALTDAIRSALDLDRRRFRPKPTKRPLSG